MASEKYAQPERRPAVVTGASLRHRRRDRARAGRGRLPGRARRAPYRQARGGRRRRSARTAARPSCTRSTSPTTTRSRRSPRRSQPTSATSRWWSATPARSRPGTIIEVDSERFTRELDLTVVGAHRLVRAFVPGDAVERRRGDIVFVSSDTAVRAAAVHGGVLLRQVGARGPGRTRCRWSSRAPASARRSSGPARPGARWARDWDPDEAAFVLNQWVRFGLARHPHFMKPAAIADAITTVVSAPRGVHLNLVEVNPEAPVEDAMTDDDPTRSRTPSPTTATATSPRCGSTRSGCSTGSARSAATSAGSGWPTRTWCMVTGAEANEQFFRAPDSTLDQAAAYPFMTPIFGKGVVFDASPEERQQMLKNQALRGDMMRGHAQTIEAEINRMVAEWGDEGEIDLLDWFAELTIYTTIGLPDRQAVPRGARLVVRPALPRARARHRRDRVRRPVRRHRVASAAATPRASSSSSWCRGSSTSARSAGKVAARGARPARRAHLDRHDAPTTSPASSSR